MAKLAKPLGRKANRRTGVTSDQTSNTQVNIGTIFNFEDSIFNYSSKTGLELSM